MKSNTKFFLKISAKTLLFLFITSFLFNPINAEAMFVDFNATANAKEMLKGMGVDMSTLDKFIDTFNVSDRKNQNPQVALNFNPTNPVPGQKVTVVATPKYFMNDDADLYFTWYLKSRDCTDKKTDKNNYRYNKNCDLNDDDKVDIEDYKIKAMRIIANNDFEWEKADYGDKDTDDDGYNAILGGDDQKDKNNFCYAYDTKSGREQPIKCAHLFPDAPKEETGDNKFNETEENFWHTDPNDDDTADTGNGDEANIAGLGIVSFTWTYTQGDKVGVVVEGISNEPTKEYDSSYMTMWAFPNNTCDGDFEYFEGEETEISTAVYDFGDLIVDEGSLPEDLPAEVLAYIEGEAASWLTQVGRSIEFNVTKETSTSFDDESHASIRTTYDVSYNSYNADGTIKGRSISKSFPQETENHELSNNAIRSAGDLNDCLYSNLIDPAEGGGRAQKLDLTLSYNPEFPINDTKKDSDDGDILNVSSNIINAENPEYLRYKWEVFASDVPNPESWGEAISKQYLPEATQTIGLGLSDFSFRLNLTDDALANRVDDINNFYLKVKLTVTEGVPKGITENAIETSVKREGHTDVVIPVSSTTQRIQVFNTQATDASGEIKLSPGNTEKCTEEMEQALCPVAKNDIVSLQIDKENLTDFLWTINGEPIKPMPSSVPCLSGECNKSDLSTTHIAYFPVLDDIGAYYTVNLKAMSLDGEKINLTRTFQVVEPKVKIMSDDETVCQPLLLGHYTDLDGQEWPDYSTSNFIALAGEDSTVKLKALFSGITPEQSDYAWYVDGLLVNSDNASALGYGVDDNILILPAKSWGEFYDVSLDFLYTQDNLTKKALYTYWKVPYSQFYEKSLSSSIEVRFTDFIDTETGVISQKNKSQDKILASLMSSTPAYLAYLFRIVITAFLMLVSSRIILSFFPNIKENN